MKIRHKEIETTEENPFANCKLERECYAKVLSGIVSTYAEGFVLAINNEWGTGKTTFVKMWEQTLRKDGFQTVYFNAWENDFDNNPLVALMSELKTLLNDKNDIIFKSVVEKGAILAKNVLPALLRSVLKTYTGIDADMFVEGVENVTKGATEILEKEITEYTTKKKTVLEFRDELEKFIKEAGADKPLVFFIDELDRCRPNYAVEVLEQVKHFFSVPGIVFVLSIDKRHLASSIKGYYGSESINTDEYLRRFIDLEYSIPKPSTMSFCGYLYDYYSFGDFFSSQARKRYGEFGGDAQTFFAMAELLFDRSNATLRQQEKMLMLTRLVLSSFQSNQYIYPRLLFILVYLKTMKNQLYEGIRNNIYSLQELCDIFEDFLLPFDVSNKNIYCLSHVVALLLLFYNNNQKHRNKKEELFHTDPDGRYICLIKSKFGEDNLSECLNHMRNHRDYFMETGLDYLLNKIDLIEPIQNN